MALLDYRAPRLAANSISTNFHGNRHAAVVLDVACGTGMVSKEVHSQDNGKKKKNILDTIIPEFLRTNSNLSLVRTRINNITFLFLAFQYKSICLANSQHHVWFLNR